MDNRVAGRRIAALRQARGMTQQQLAAMMNVSHQAVSKWESGLALPDIQTMLELTRFFGITVEQLLEEEQTEVEMKTDETANDTPEENDEPKKEVEHMNITQLLQMAPFMSKAAVEEIAWQLEEPLSANQLARLAPFISAEALCALIDKHKPQFSWDSLKKLAPFMGKEAVDALARAIASGEEKVKPAGDDLNKTINDIGKAFDHLGKDVGQAFDGLGRKAKKGVKKVIRFGGKVINEVSSAINDLADDETQETKRSEQSRRMRMMAFERALEMGRWDWIGLHIDEIRDNAELMSKIAARARELEKYEWICEYLNGYADEEAIRSAIANANWDWLGENVWQMEPEMQREVAMSAVDNQNWKWLEMYSDLMNLGENALIIAQRAIYAGERALAAQLAHKQMTQAQAAVIAQIACSAADFETLEFVLDLADKSDLHRMLLEHAERGEWEAVMRFARAAESECIGKLMEMAVEQGNFEAIDLLDVYYK